MLMLWELTNKGDVRCRILADKHYTRQSPGDARFTRPGYNMVLYCEDSKGAAVFVWWRPKWEDGRPGTTRKDNLEAIECTLFRNETAMRSSDLIRDAVEILPQWNRFTFAKDGLITGIGVEQTKHRRSKNSLPGHCYLMAGWQYFTHRSGKAQVWLKTLCPCKG